MDVFENKSFLLYLIGLSGSGKTTIGTLLNKYFKENSSRKLQFIDGDVIRGQFGNIFGYTKEERLKYGNIVNVVVQYLLENDVSVILAQVCPYEEWRVHMRSMFGDKYIQCYIQCSFEERCRRDPKGYYKKFKEGKMKNFNGANDVFDIPQNNEIVINTEILKPQESVEKILNYFKKKYHI